MRSSTGPRGIMWHACAEAMTFATTLSMNRRSPRFAKQLTSYREQLASERRARQSLGAQADLGRKVKRARVWALPRPRR